MENSIKKLERHVAKLEKQMMVMERMIKTLIGKERKVEKSTKRTDLENFLRKGY